MEGFGRSLKQLSKSCCGFAPSEAWPLDLSWTPAHHPSFPSEIWALTHQEAVRSAKRYVVCLIQRADSSLSCLNKLMRLPLWFVCFMPFCIESQLNSITPCGAFVTLQSVKPEIWSKVCTITLQAFSTLGSRYAEQVFKHYFVKINEMSEFITVNKEQLCSLLGESAFTADNQSEHNGAGSSEPRYELTSSEGKAALQKPVRMKENRAEMHKPLVDGMTIISCLLRWDIILNLYIYLCFFNVSLFLFFTFSEIVSFH